MSYSLQIKGGDLVAQAGQLSIATGAQKMLQDLQIFVMTQMGSDPYNPSYGSLIDGGIQPNGNVVSSPIGTMNWSLTESFIQQEISRIVSVYQASQNTRVQQDLQTYNKNTLTSDEIVTALTGISINQNIDTMIVNVSIQNASGNELTFSIPVQGSIL